MERERHQEDVKRGQNQKWKGRYSIIGGRRGGGEVRRQEK